jgi:hypothetical protein
MNRKKATENGSIAINRKYSPVAGTRNKNKLLSLHVSSREGSQSNFTAGKGFDRIIKNINKTISKNIEIISKTPVLTFAF